MIFFIVYYIFVLYSIIGFLIQNIVIILQTNKLLSLVLIVMMRIILVFLLRNDKQMKEKDVWSDQKKKQIIGS